MLLTSSGPGAVEDVIVRIPGHLFEEAEEWPATSELLSILKEYGPPDGKVAALSAQSFSTGLLFAQSVKQCVERGATEISRDCVLEQAKQVTEWDGQGLFAAADPATNTPPKCSMLIQVKDGKWTRLYPELDSADDDGQGFSCTDPGVVTIEGDFGEGNVDPTRKQ